MHVPDFSFKGGSGHVDILQVTLCGTTSLLPVLLLLKLSLSVNNDLDSLA
jgi:hypothetical protein